MFQELINQLYRLGAQRIFIKPLANNDNSKQQIYLGSDFDVIRAIPSGEIRSESRTAKSAIFKAPLDFYWITPDGQTENAPNAQIIFYPNYPETRLSGFLQGTNPAKGIAPSKLMRPPTPAERAERGASKRYLFLGFDNKTVWAYCTDWKGRLNREAAHEIKSLELATSVFFEYGAARLTSEQKLLKKLAELYRDGPIKSCRLNTHGKLIPYSAQNGAGYTLEAQFGITPNGSSDPDFMDWELKAHSRGAITLMTPEPTEGLYIDNLHEFLSTHGTNIKEKRMDFASRHNVGVLNDRSGLILRMEGYDPENQEILDPGGGLVLRDKNNLLAAYWGFDKLIGHWKKKHANTCFVTYRKKQGNPPFYHYGPLVRLCRESTLKLFLDALSQNVIFYDPGVNMTLRDNHWKAKKRNQFRVRWPDIHKLYTQIKEFDLSEFDLNQP